MDHDPFQFTNHTLGAFTMPDQDQFISEMDTEYDPHHAIMLRIGSLLRHITLLKDASPPPTKSFHEAMTYLHERLMNTLVLIRTRELTEPYEFRVEKGLEAAGWYYRDKWGEYIGPYNSRKLAIADKTKKGILKDIATVEAQCLAD